MVRKSRANQTIAYRGDLVIHVDLLWRLFYHGAKDFLSTAD
jgi:hypothetical protein